MEMDCKEKNEAAQKAVKDRKKKKKKSKGSPESRAKRVAEHRMPEEGGSASY